MVCSYLLSLGVLENFENTLFGMLLELNHLITVIYFHLKFSSNGQETPGLKVSGLIFAICSV